MIHIKKTFERITPRGRSLPKVFMLSEELDKQGYFIHKHLRGWQMCKHTKGNQVWWSSSLKNLDHYIDRYLLKGISI